MENEKKGIKCSYAVLVIVLFAALAFVTSYAYIQNKTTKCSCPDCSLSGNANVVNDKIGDPVRNDFGLYNEYGYFIITKDGDVYCHPLKGFDMSDSTIFTKGQVEVDYQVISMNEEENVFDGYKVNISNVRSAYSYGYGQQGGDYAIVFIHNNGMVSVLYLTNDYEGHRVELEKNIGNFTDIITAVKTSFAGGENIQLIDENGNMFLLPVV